MEKLSPPGFHVEISWNFDITCKNGRLNLILTSVKNFALFSLEYEENHGFLQLSVGKTISS